VTSLADGSVYNFSLGYNPDSSIASSSDAVNGNWTYTYDDFARLYTAGETGLAFNYQYDRFGNRWQQNVTTGQGPQPSYGFDTSNHINSSGIVYDAAGNVINDGVGNTDTYDAEHRVLTVGGTNAASYVYDAMGRRVRATINGTAKDYIFDAASRAVTQMSPTWQRSELYAGGLHVATYSGSTTYFEHSDWLASVRARTPVSGGTPVETCTSLPFGDALTCTGTDWSPLHFTGKELDSETGLFHFLFRQLSTIQGRWTVPDPAGAQAASLFDPQTLDRYTYGLNNPVTATDSLGLVYDNPMHPWHGFGDGWDIFDLMQIPVVGGSQFGLLWSWTLSGPVSPTTSVAEIDENGDITYQPSDSTDDLFGISKMLINGFYNSPAGTLGASDVYTTFGGGIGTLSRGTFLGCASARANSMSIARVARVDNSTLGQAFLGNGFSGAYEAYNTLKNTSNAGEAYTILFLNGYRLGLPGGGNLSKGVYGIAQDEALKAAFTNLGPLTGKLAAKAVGGAKISYDALTFGYGAAWCAYHR
jgi:RHS repeat-associated protein